MHKQKLKNNFKKNKDFTNIEMNFLSVIHTNYNTMN